MKSSSDSSSAAGGIGFCGLLTIAFVVLRLCGVIHWPWVWVLAPVWIPIAAALAGLLVLGIVVACTSREK